MNAKAIRRLAREVRWLIQRDRLPPGHRQEASVAVSQILSGNVGRAGEGSNALAQLEALCNRYRPHWTQHVLEPILVVAILFLALRTFFVQSFTVTTGSMEPTLRGERWEDDSSDPSSVPPGWLFRLRDRGLAGVSHHFIRAEASGIVGPLEPRHRLLWLSWQRIQIGDRFQTLWFPPPIDKAVTVVQRFAESPWPPPGTRINVGDWLVAGRFVRGERILVDRLSYNFVRPRRGQIVVFSTRGLPAGPGELNPAPLEPFAVKRLVGLAGESVDSWVVRPAHVFVLGDNTGVSLDSRHWGDISEDRLVGRCWFRYWPLARHDGAKD